LIEEPPLGIATWHFFAALTAIVYRAAAISRIIFCTSVGRDKWAYPKDDGDDDNDYDGRIEAAI